MESRETELDSLSNSQNNQKTRNLSAKRGDNFNYEDDKLINYSSQRIIRQ